MSLAPIFALYYGSFMAEKVKFTDDYIEYEGHPVTMKLVPKNKFHEEYVKEIISEFAPKEESSYPSAIQGIVDENFVNSIIGMFLKQQQNWSVRELLSLDPRLKVMREMLTTTTIGVTIPSFKEQYGESKPVDIVIDSTQSFMDEGLGTVTPTSVSLDANGNFNIVGNIGF
jgi:hypothetical protein